MYVYMYVCMYVYMYVYRYVDKSNCQSDNSEWHNILNSLKWKQPGDERKKERHKDERKKERKNERKRKDGEEINQLDDSQLAQIN